MDMINIQIFINYTTLHAAYNHDIILILNCMPNLHDAGFHLVQSLIFNNNFINIIVMKLNNNTQSRPLRDHSAISQLINTLKQVDLNNSWKGTSIKMNKTKTGVLHDQKTPNRMTEQDVEKLFEKSNQKGRMRTEISKPTRTTTQTSHHQKAKDFTLVKFLRIEEDYDKFLTGFPLSNKENQFQVANDPKDLTSKFKQNYIVGKVIGEGAYALVRVAIFKPQNKKIAIKAYEKSKIRQLARKKTVRRQIKILQCIDHSNIVKIFDVVQTNNHLNIIMQYLPGISLGVSLKEQPNQKFTEANCKLIMKQLAHALKYLHERNIAHRDIKLQNIILDEKIKPKIIDFGFSTCIQRNTKMKIFCGTPSYMAPEIVQKKEYRGQAADIWALGVMMFVMLTGYFPYRGSTDEELYKKINSADYPKQDITALKHAHHLISKMFTLDPEERITADGILNHPWIAKPKDMPPTVQRRAMNETQLRKLLSGSKEKNPSQKGDSNGKRKRQYELIYAKNIHRSKELTNNLNNTLNHTTKIQKITKTYLQADKSHSNGKLKAENVYKPDQKLKVLDALKLQLRKCSQQKGKCKSHRM